MIVLLYSRQREVEGDDADNSGRTGDLPQQVATSR